MKQKNKGFTLIELLAVIVILAIIALIATPIILNVIESSRENAAVDSAYGYIKAIENNNSMAGFDDEYTMITNPNVLEINKIVKVKGNKATSGTVTIVDGEVTEASICIGGYDIEYKNDVAQSKGKCGSTSTDDDVVVLEGDPILDKAKTLVYDESGKCKSEDTYEYMGGCYIKGASTNNYVWYNGFMWRIMGINKADEDGTQTVRLITDENVASISYGSYYGQAENYATNAGYINDWLNKYFYSNLNSTKSIIKEGKYFCVESSTNSSRANDKCTSGKELNAKIGMISLDEKNLIGEADSYLHIGQNFWTITPSGSINAWRMDYYRGRTESSKVTNINGVRPVINVEGSSIITEGEGTAQSYYVLAENKKVSYIDKKIGDIVTSGEYVKLGKEGEEKTYRVVSKDTTGVKLILDGYYDKKMAYGNDNTFTTESGIGKTLNSDVLNWLDLATSDKIKETTWYQGTAIDSPLYSTISNEYKYTISLSDNNIVDNGKQFKVGIIRIGEMLSGQSSTILTNNYEEASSYENAQRYLTMNKNTTTSLEWYISNYGEVSTFNVSSQDNVRPVIVVKSELPISGGNGTWNNPYKI